jgi:hypothetical protein
MAEPFQTVNHENLLEFLLEQFKWRTDGTQSRVAGMIKMIADEMNLAEDALQELLHAFDITTAVGDQLDLLGKIFGAARLGLSDAAYRPVILLAATTAMSGTPEQVIAFVRSVVGGSAPIRLQTVAPAKVMLYYDTGVITGVTTSQIEQVLPAGVGVILADIRVTDDGTPRVTDDGTPRLVGG